MQADADPAVRLGEALDLCRRYLNLTTGPMGFGPLAVYNLLDTLADAIKAKYPQSLCKSGCSGCCQQHRAFIRIHRIEWEPMAGAIAAWEPERRDVFLARFWAVHGPYLPTYEAWQAKLDEADRVQAPRPNPVRDEFPIDCPMLEDQRCQVYAERPAICRAFGHFGLSSTATDGKIYACADQQEVLAPEGHRRHSDGKLTVPLPSFTPFYRRLEELAGHKAPATPDEPSKAPGDLLLIALWVARTFPRAT